jgi:hypothetical protein
MRGFENMKYYNVELSRTRAEKLQQILYNAGVYFEISKNGQYYHFEILTDPDGASAINNFLDNNTIWCKGI